MFRTRVKVTPEVTNADLKDFLLGRTTTLRARGVKVTVSGPGTVVVNGREV